MIGLSTEGRKQDLQDRLDCHFMQPNYFNLLPDELLLKIVKMVVKKECNQSREYTYYEDGGLCRKTLPTRGEDYDHDFLVDVISLISKRFSRISKDRALWTGLVIPTIRSTDKIEHVVNSFISDKVDKLLFDGKPCKSEPAISADHISAIADRCPGLKRLELFRVGLETWPSHCALRSLEIIDIFALSFNSEVFRHVKLHQILPQLKIFRVGLQAEEAMPIWLPDMTHCKELRVIHLRGKFRIPPMPMGKVPFPRGLEELVCYANIINCSKTRMRNCMKDWDCEKKFSTWFH